MTTTSNDTDFREQTGVVLAEVISSHPRTLAFVLTQPIEWRFGEDVRPGRARLFHTDATFGSAPTVVWADSIQPACPDCHGLTEITASQMLTCREHGSDHYRQAVSA